MNENKFLMEVGNRICIRRRELGMTQELLAEKMDVSIQMISNLELGKKAIRPENLVKLCKALRISSDYILTGKQAEWELEAFANRFAALSPEDQRLLNALLTRLQNKT